MGLFLSGKIVNAVLKRPTGFTTCNPSAVDEIVHVVKKITQICQYQLLLVI